MRDFRQIEWDHSVEEDLLTLVRLAVREDLARAYDWTTVALVPTGALGSAAIVARQAGIACGLLAIHAALAEVDPQVRWEAELADGAAIEPGDRLASLHGPARSLLTLERTILNFIGRLSGIATLARQYVEAVAGTGVRIYDTRKTTPGWRRLEKYAVRCGGGCNHRLGLYDAVLIKDNHLSLGRAGEQPFSPAEAVRRVRELVRQAPADEERAEMIVEVEVDTLEQLADVLPVGPDLVLLDNMSLDLLRRAVAVRDRTNPQVQLEASGGVRLETVRAIAETGVERISVGALTHAATWLDVGLDWTVGEA